MNQNRTSLERISDTEILIKRTFRAPAAILFDAYTKPEYVRRWWAPASLGVAMLECDVDLRPGGAYRYVLEHGAGEIAFSGEYLEIVPPARLVYTQRFEPMPGEAVVTVTFEEREGATTLVSHERYPSKEALDTAIASGMEAGLRVTFDQLDELVSASSA